MGLVRFAQVISVVAGIVSEANEADATAVRAPTGGSASKVDAIDNSMSDDDVVDKSDEEETGEEADAQLQCKDESVNGDDEESVRTALCAGFVITVAAFFSGESSTIRRCC